MIWSRTAARAPGPLRLVALWALLVFAAGWSEDALVLHPCPHHAAIAHARHAAGHMGMEHGAAPHDGGPAPEPGSHHGPCTCTTACSGTGLATVSRAPEPPPVVESSAGRRTAPPATAALPGRRHHLLPYPTPPPAVPA